MTPDDFGQRCVLQGDAGRMTAPTGERHGAYHADP